MFPETREFAGFSNAAFCHFTGILRRRFIQITTRIRNRLVLLPPKYKTKSQFRLGKHSCKDAQEDSLAAVRCHPY